MPSLGVFAAIFDVQGRVLCVRHNYGARDWGMPGGQIESGEDPLTAVEREIAEETGVIADINELVGVYSAPYRDDLVILFKGNFQERGDWIPNNEISECGFFPLSGLPTPMGPNSRARFEDIGDGAWGVICTFAAPGERVFNRSLRGGPRLCL